MPTLEQLPLARTTNPTDQALLQQGTETVSVTLATMLAGTQAAITLASGTLLGRVSALPGSPEPVVMGEGLAVENGALTLAPLTITGDVSGGGVGTIDLTLPAITAAGTYPKVTVNAKGLVTNGVGLAANDVVAALGFMPYSNANPSGFVTSTALTALAPLSSPDFSGTPTAPTPPVSDNSQAIATTAFVQAHSTSLTAAAISSALTAVRTHFDTVRAKAWTSEVSGASTFRCAVACSPTIETIGDRAFLAL